MKHGTVGGYTNHGCRCGECREAHRLYWAEYRSNHRVEEQMRVSRSYRRHREKHAEAVARRKARKMAAFVEDIDRGVVLERDQGYCGICDELVDPNDFHIDHVIPISLGGAHSYANVQVAHPFCNLRKGAKLAV